MRLGGEGSRDRIKGAFFPRKGGEGPSRLEVMCEPVIVLLVRV
jgi:hypothetical protein